LTLNVEGTATERCECTAGSVVEFAHPFHKVEAGCVNCRGEDAKGKSEDLHEHEDDKAERCGKITRSPTVF